MRINRELSMMVKSKPYDSKKLSFEEREHAGEFLRLLRELDPEEEKFYKEGYEEVEEMIAELKK